MAPRAMNYFSTRRYNCDSYLELFILTTHSTKRYPGLSTELVKQTLDLARRKEFAVCVASATSFYSQKIFARLGFESLKVHPFTFTVKGTPIYIYSESRVILYDTSGEVSY